MIVDKSIRKLFYIAGPTLEYFTMITDRFLFWFLIASLLLPTIAIAQPVSSVTLWHVCFENADQRADGTRCELFDLRHWSDQLPDTADHETLVDQVTTWTEDGVASSVRSLLSQRMEILAHVTGTIRLDFDRQTAWVTVVDVIPSTAEPVFVILKVISQP